MIAICSNPFSYDWGVSLSVHESFRASQNSFTARAFWNFCWEEGLVSSYFYLRLSLRFMSLNLRIMKRWSSKEFNDSDCISKFGDSCIIHLFLYYKQLSRCSHPQAFPGSVCRVSCKSFFNGACHLGWAGHPLVWVSGGSRSFGSSMYRWGPEKLLKHR